MYSLYLQAWEANGGHLTIKRFTNLCCHMSLNPTNLGLQKATKII